MANISHENATLDAFTTLSLNETSSSNVTISAIVTTTEALIKEADIFDRVLEGLTYVNYTLLPLMLVVGLCGNTLSIIVLNTKRYRHLTSRFFLVALAISDTTLLLTQPFNKIFVIRLIGFDVRALSEVGCKFFFWFFRTGKMTSSWFVVFMCLERFVAVWFPLKAKLIVSKKVAIIGIALVYLVIGTFNAVWTYNSKIAADNMCYPDVFDKSDPSEVQWYRAMLTAGSSLYSLIPICFLITFTPMILYKIAQHRAKRREMTQNKTNQSNDQMVKVTAMLVSVVVAYFILIVPITTLHNIAFYLGVKSFGNNTKRFLIFRDVAQILEQINYGINFVLYVVTSKQFREGLIELLRLQRLLAFVQRIRTTTSRTSSSGDKTKKSDKLGTTSPVNELKAANYDHRVNMNCIVDQPEIDGDKMQEVVPSVDQSLPEPGNGEAKQ